MCCSRCGRPTHGASRCSAATDVTDDICHRCGRAGHHELNCMASGDDRDHDGAAVVNNRGTYVLASSRTGHRYVGTSRDIRRRVQQHIAGAGALATQRMAAMRRVVPLPLCAIRPPSTPATGKKGSSTTPRQRSHADAALLSERKVCGCTDFSARVYDNETRQTLAQMRVHGITRVRGGPLCAAVFSDSHYWKISVMLGQERRRLMRAMSASRARGNEINHGASSVRLRKIRRPRLRAFDAAADREDHVAATTLARSAGRLRSSGVSLSSSSRSSRPPAALYGFCVVAAAAK